MNWFIRIPIAGFIYCPLAVGLSEHTEPIITCLIVAMVIVGEWITNTAERQS